MCGQLFVEFLLRMILVLHQGAIGDFVLTLSVVQAVRSLLADRQRSPYPVEVIASSAMARLVAGRSAVDVYVSPEQVGLHTLFSEQGVLDERLAAMLTRSRWVLNFLGGTNDPIHRRLEAATQGHVISVETRPTETTLTDETHITSQWSSAIRAQGLDIDEPTPPHIRIAESREGTHSQAPCSKTPSVIVHPGSGGRDKCWPVENFIALAELLQDNVDVHWMLGPAECEPVDERFDALHRRADAGLEMLIVESDLEEALTKIADAALYVGNDGGMTHAAAAIGVPTVAIFTATNPAVWRPLGDHVTVVAPESRDCSLSAVAVEHVRQIIDQRLRSE